MSVLAIQPSTIDAYICLDSPDVNFNNVNLLVRSGTGPPSNRRTLIKFDFSALPDNAVISAGTLSLYYFEIDGGPIGRTYWVNELTQIGWVETQVTWNNYKTGSAWANAGGDYVTNNGASIIVPASYPAWVEWNVLALVQHFQSVHDKIGHFLIRDGSEDNNPYKTGFFVSKDYTGNPTLKPILTITYTLPEQIEVRIRIKKYQDFSRNFAKRKEI